MQKCKVCNETMTILTSINAATCVNKDCKDYGWSTPIVDSKVAGWSVPESGLRKDATNPDHYKTGGMQPIEYMEMKMTPEMVDGFLLGNVIKYISRYQNKNGLEDLKKANWYLARLIERSSI